jgi:hypothetical protein
MVFKSNGWATMGKYITAIDYKTGKIAWRHLQPSAGEGSNHGLTTAGKLLFSGDSNNNLVAYDPAMESRYGIRISARYPMRWKPTCLTESSTSWQRSGDTLYAFALNF